MQQLQPAKRIIVCFAADYRTITIIKKIIVIIIITTFSCNENIKISE